MAKTLERPTDPEVTMRFDYLTLMPDALKGILNLEMAIKESSLEPELLELVKMRASQINGCAFCLDMHSKDARARGESEQRLYMLPGWREASLYTERERAALDWCESLTELAQTGAPDSAYEPLTEQFSEEEIVALTFAIVAINGWNRLAVGTRSPAGDYVSPYTAT